MAGAQWDPSRYERFSGHRSRPFADLLARVGADEPRLVVDLGCGTGTMTMRAASRWPTARVVGIDSSPTMLQRARELDSAGRVQWMQADIADWDVRSAGEPDVVLSNAALQWVPGHRELISRWCRQLRDGSWFALQVPGNFDAPSHRSVAEAAAAHPRHAQLVPLLPVDPVGQPADYAELLADGCQHVDVWETTYLQILDPAGESADPVLDWLRGTTLLPLLAVLDDADRRAFLDDLSGRLVRAYPRRRYGVPFAFRRIFAVGQRG